jgi:NADH-quinone oxidoreductase subunit N
MPDYTPAIPNFTQLSAIGPEIILAMGMCVALLLPLLAQDLCRKSNKPMLLVGMVTCALAALAALTDLGSDSLAGDGHTFFFGTLTIDPFSQTVKALILVFTILVFLQFSFLGLRKQVPITDSPDYVSLILGAVLGMCLMASASNLLMMFIAIETASFPSYALAGFRKTTKEGPEASLKYVLFGSVASAIMLYGLSMLYGQYGTLDFHTLAAEAAASGPTWGLALGVFGIMIGVGFKLSLFPVHFWCPDVFEGASMEITTFLSIASKGAAVALLLRVTQTIGHAAVAAEQFEMLTGITIFIGVMGGITATWGNLAALRQDSIKRMLAYSSIAHAGYMTMACALLGRSFSRINDDPAMATNLANALLFYLVIYFFMNLGAFTLAGLIEKGSGTLAISKWTGLARRSPAVALLMLVLLGSLFGFPPLGGFWGKVLIGFEMWNGGAWWLLAILLANTVISSYYYLLRPAYFMFMAPDEGLPRLTVDTRGLVLAGVCAAVVVITLAPQTVMSWTSRDARMLLQTPVVEEVEAAAPAEAILEELAIVESR